MNTANDPSAALASLLAILSQSTQNQANLSSLQNLPNPQSTPVEPIFPQGDILDTSEWIGMATTPWYEPRTWQLPGINAAPLGTPPGKKPPSLSRRDIPPRKSFATYSHALKHIIQQSQADDFLNSIRGMK